MASPESPEREFLTNDLGFIRVAMQRNYVQLTEHLKAGELLPELFAQGIFTLEAKQELDRVQDKSGSIKLSKAVVDKLQERSITDKDLRIFLDILSSRQRVIYDYIMTWIEEIKTSGNAGDLSKKSEIPSTDGDLEKRYQAKITDLQYQLAMKEFDNSGLKLDLARKNDEVQSLKQRIERLEVQEKALKVTKGSSDIVPKMQVGKISDDNFDFIKTIQGEIRNSLPLLLGKKTLKSKNTTQFNYDGLKWQVKVVEYGSAAMDTNITILKSNLYSNSSNEQYSTLLKDQFVETSRKLTVEFEPSIWINTEFPLELPSELVSKSQFSSSILFCPGQDIREEKTERLSLGEMTITIPSGKMIKVTVLAKQRCWTSSFQMKLLCDGFISTDVMSPEGKLEINISTDVRELVRRSLENHRGGSKNVVVTREGVEFEIHGKLKASFCVDLQTELENCPFQ